MCRADIIANFVNPDRIKNMEGKNENGKQKENNSSPMTTQEA